MPSEKRSTNTALFLSVLVIATSGLVYQLISGTMASYVLGDSVAQFSLIIGLYLFAMGVGSWLSKYLETRLIARFVEIELGLALAGGLSAPILFTVYTQYGAFRVMLYVLVFVIGTLVGLEIPLLIRLLKFSLDLKELVARVLTLDYIGALVGSVMFPTILLPRLGLHQTSLLFGALNAVVALGSTFLFPLDRPLALRLRLMSVGVLAVLTVAFFSLGTVVDKNEASYYGSPIIFAKQSPYQRLILTRSSRTTRLFLNGNLQFSSDDEYRYHEVLVHVPVAALQHPPRQVLVMGGGDGLAARELLRYPSVEKITLVDLDAAVTDLFRTHPDALELNGGSLNDSRVEIHNLDAYRYLETAQTSYDLAIVDFPDPSNYSVGKLYTLSFYQLLRERIAPRGVVIVQSTSPQFAPKSFWSIVATMEAAEWKTLPLHAYVPSFGDWGFVIAGGEGMGQPTKLLIDSEQLRFVDDQMLGELFYFAKDIGRIDAPINRLNDQKLVPTYTSEWESWER